MHDLITINTLKILKGDCPYKGCLHCNDGYCNLIEESHQFCLELIEAISRDYICTNRQPKSNQTCLLCGHKLETREDTTEYMGIKCMNMYSACSNPMCDNY